MIDAEARAGRFVERLCHGHEISVAANGARLVEPDPSQGSIAALHTIYPPLEFGSEGGVRDALGRELAPAERAIFSITNGMTLCDRMVSIYGLTGPTITRDLTRPTPISLEWEAEVFGAMFPELVVQGGATVGGVAIAQSYRIVSFSSGACELLEGESGLPVRRFHDLLELLETVTSELKHALDKQRGRPLDYQSIEQFVLAGGAGH